MRPFLILFRELRVIRVRKKSRLDRESQIDPRIQSANDGADAGKAVVQEEERRTGARVFIRSGTVGDDPHGRVERDSGGIGFDAVEGNRARARDVLGCV